MACLAYIGTILMRRHGMLRSRKSYVASMNFVCCFRRNIPGATWISWLRGMGVIEMTLRGMMRLSDQEDRLLLVGGDGFAVDEFLQLPVESWMNRD